MRYKGRCSAPELRARREGWMEYLVLGSLEVRAGDGPLPLGGAKQRALLALLLLNVNRVVSRERLIDDLWGDDPPATAVTTVQVYVSRLRKLLPEAGLRTLPPEVETSGFVPFPSVLRLLRSNSLFIRV